MTQLAIFLVRLYKLCISPFIGPTCRYYPTCSDYMVKALTTFGFFKGVWAGFKRILRCNPYSRGGYDPLEKDDTSPFL